MYKPDFSIIIPAYNSQQTIKRAVTSVFNQLSGSWELIIIDDGSTDDTKNRIAAYLEDERLSYHFQENSGVSSARNKGVQNARADYVIFLDSDDELHPELFEKLEENKYYNFDLIFWYVKKMTGQKVEIVKPKKLEKIYNNQVALFLAGSVCYRKMLIEKVGGFDSDLEFGENYELGMRITKLENLKCLIISNPFLKYHLHPKNRSNSRPRVKLKSLEHLLFKHEELYRLDKPSYSRLTYQLGYLYEKLGAFRKARVFYKKAFKIRRVYYKPLLKMIYLKFKK